MPAHVVFIRCSLGLLCIAFAHALGRAGYRKFKLHVRDSYFARWVLRTAVAAAGAMWHGGLDAVSIATLGLSAASAVLGVYLERRPRTPEEDLTKVIFPHDEGDK